MNLDKDKYRLLTENLTDAYSLQQLVTDSEGKPVDYIFLEVNKAFEKMTGLTEKNIIGKRVTEVLPGIEKSKFDWIAFYGEVVLTGKTAYFEQYFEPLERYYEVTAYRVDDQHFSTIFRDVTDRKEKEMKEESTRKSQQLAQSVLDSLNANVCVLDDQGYIIEVNQSWFDFAVSNGGRIEDVRPGINYLEVCDQVKGEKREMAKRFAAGIRELIRGEKDCFSMEYPCDAPKKERWFICEAISFFDMNLDSLIVVVTHIDITERKQMEKELAEYSEQYRLLVENLQEGIWYIDAVGYTKYVNQVMAEMLGYTITEMQGKHLYEFLKEEEKKRVENLLERRKQGIKEAHELELTHKDGFQIIARLLASPIFDKTGNFIGALAAVQDITEKREREKQVMKFRQALDSSADSFYLIDCSTYRFVDANEPGCEALGYTRQELMELTPFDIKPYLSREELEAKFASVVNRSTSNNHKSEKFNSVETFETYHQRKDGSCFPVEVSLRMVDVAQEQLLVATVRDITERRQTEKLIEARLNLLTFASQHTLEEVLQKTLDEVGDMLNSPIGFFHFVSEDETMLTLKAWSSDTLQYFCDMGDKSGMQYRVDEAGVWVDCVRERRPVIHNDYASLSHRKGIPEDHAMVVRELVVPVMRDDRIVAIMGIGNNPRDYTDEDIQVASFIADVAWEIVEDKLAEQKILDYTMEVEMKSLQLENVYSQLNEELDKVRAMHERNLPEEMPDVEGLPMHAYYQPAQRMGGDFYHASKVDNKLVFYVSDVTGHGMEGALLSTFVKEAIDSYITLKPEDIEPGKILRHLNRQYCRENYPDDYFICIFIMVLDLETMELTYTGAGFHELPLVQLGTGEKLSLHVKGLPISSVIPEEMMNYREGKIKLTPGSTVLVSTDGLVEQTAGEELYGQRLSQVFYEHSHLPPEIIISAILEDFYSFNGGSMQAEDDITLGVVQVEPVGSKKMKLELESNPEALSYLRQEVLKIIPKDGTGDMFLNGLHELAANAIEHANNFDPPKKVNVEISVTEHAFCASVKDEGAGFDWRQKLGQPFELENSSDRGRGIAMAQMGGGKLFYNEKGNHAYYVFKMEY